MYDPMTIDKEVNKNGRRLALVLLIVNTLTMPAVTVNTGLNQFSIVVVITITTIMLVSCVINPRLTGHMEIGTMLLFVNCIILLLLGLMHSAGASYPDWIYLPLMVGIPFVLGMGE